MSHHNPSAHAFSQAVSIITSQRGEPVMSRLVPEGPSGMLSARWLIGEATHGVRASTREPATVECWGTIGVAARCALTAHTDLRVEHILMAATATGLLDPDGPVET